MKNSQRIIFHSSQPYTHTTNLSTDSPITTDPTVSPVVKTIHLVTSPPHRQRKTSSSSPDSVLFSTIDLHNKYKKFLQLAVVLLDGCIALQQCNVFVSWKVRTILFCEPAPHPRTTTVRNSDRSRHKNKKQQAEHRRKIVILLYNVWYVSQGGLLS